MRLRFVLISFFALTVAVCASADNKMHVVNPTVYASAAEQLQAATELRLKIALATTDEARVSAVANAAATAWVVQSKWPDDIEAVFTSHLLLADIFRDGKAPKNAAESLEAGRAVAARLGREAMIDVRIAEVRRLLRDDKGTRSALAAAARPEALRRLDKTQATSVLQVAGRLYGEIGEHNSAAECYRRAAQTTPAGMRRATLLVYAGREHRKTGDRSAAKDAAAAARQALNDVRRNNRLNGDGAFDTLESLENQIADLEKN
jgi:tetratricopeptide (TPR) repeat protein